MSCTAHTCTADRRARFRPTKSCLHACSRTATINQYCCCCIVSTFDGLFVCFPYSRFKCLREKPEPTLFLQRVHNSTSGTQSSRIREVGRYADAWGKKAPPPPAPPPHARTHTTKTMFLHLSRGSAINDHGSSSTAVDWFLS